jgi:hypothetical protein
MYRKEKKMGKREQIVIPKRFIEKYGENPEIWSFSKVSALDNCKYEYYLYRIKKCTPEDNIYTLCGTVSHDILEDYYNGKIKYEDMVDRFEQDFLAIEVSDYKFSNDEGKNVKMRNKYKECVIHFFGNHKPIQSRVITEQLIWIDVNGHLFMGYIDSIHKDEDGNYIITDYKTSSIYKGKKVQDQAKQLLLYALGLMQGGVSLNSIKIRWNFLKYTNITYKLKNGKLKTVSAERNKWVEAIKTPLKKDIKEFYKIDDWEVDLKYEECVRNNDLSPLEKAIQDKYILDDCYVYAEVNEEEIEKLKLDLVNKINEIKNNGEEELFWERDEINDSESYYCNVLCSVKKHCKYYKEYLNKLGLKNKEDDDILNDLDLPWE